MKYVIGIDLGTSAVKVLLVNQEGTVCNEISKEYPLIQERPGYSEQQPEEWVEKTLLALSELIKISHVHATDIEGISFSGQMHGLVLLDKNHSVIRNAILWNDTRTTPQCREIERMLGSKLLEITKNPALEGLTLPKLLWIKENEPRHFQQASVFLLPKDYLRLRLTGQLHSEYSDAAGTLLLKTSEKEWSREICDIFGISPNMFPPLLSSDAFVGTLLPEIADQTGLSQSTKIFAGGADNACGAVGAGILSQGESLCSIGTSGVVLSYEQNKQKDLHGEAHFFNHSKGDAWYGMGVTLSAGYSLNWFKNAFIPNESFEQMLQGLDQVPIGAGGLLFSPYLTGERTPHGDANIRGSFIGVDGSHTIENFVRAVIEGITFSLNESIEILRKYGQSLTKVVSIGGGSKNETWLQIQADVFNAEVIKLETEQGPGMGAAMLAAYGCNWFPTLNDCADVFVKLEKRIQPIPQNVEQYQALYQIYQDIYDHTKEISYGLRPFAT